MLAGVALIAVGRDFGLIHLQLPQAARQIPQEALTLGPLASAFRFAFELGTGVRTYLTGSGPYVLAAAILLLQPNAPSVALAAVGVAVGRTLPVLQFVISKKYVLDLNLIEREWIIRRVTVVLTVIGVAILSV